MLNNDGQLTRTKFRTPLLSSTTGAIYALPEAPFGSPDLGLQVGLEGVQRSEEWLKSRTAYFGASSPCAAYGVFDIRDDLTQGMPGDFPTALMAMAAHLQDVDGTGCPSTCGPPAPKIEPAPPGVAMKKGTELEDQVAAAFEAEFKVPTIPGGVYVVPGVVPIRVSLDRTTVTGFPVELKSSLRPPSGSDIETPPFYYVLQCLMQAMAVKAPGALLVMCYIDCEEYERMAEAEAAAPHPLRASVADVRILCDLWRKTKLQELKGEPPRDGFADTMHVFSVMRTAESDALLTALYERAHTLVSDIFMQPRDKPLCYSVVKTLWKSIVSECGGIERAETVAMACTLCGMSEEVRRHCFKDPKDVKLSVFSPVSKKALHTTLKGFLEFMDV